MSTSIRTKDCGRRAERRPFTLYTVRAPQPPRRATDEHGHDVLDLVARIDRRYVDDFALEPVRGYAQEHAVTLQVDVARPACCSCS